MDDNEFSEGEKLSPYEKLEVVAKEYLENPFKPEAVTNFWQAFWQVPRGEFANDTETFEVPDCNWTKEELQEPMFDVDGSPVPSLMACIPEELRGREGLIKLGKMFSVMPIMGNPSRVPDANTTINNDSTSDKTGYVKVEAGLTALDTKGKTDDEIRAIFASHGAQGQRLATFIIASQASRVLNGSLFDQARSGPGQQVKSETKLLGSVNADGSPVRARYQDGNLILNSVNKHAGLRMLGERISVGVRSEKSK